MQKILISVIACSALLGGCSDWSLPTVKLPDSIPDLVHKIDIQQGNIVNQEMINKLRPGMGKRQVRFIMGSAMINDTFHEDRWDYLYRHHKSSHAPTSTMRVTLFFKQDQLVNIEGDFRPLPTDPDTPVKKAEIIEVPPQDRSVSVFDRVLGTVGLEQEDQQPRSGSSGSGGGDQSY